MDKSIGLAFFTFPKRIWNFVLCPVRFIPLPAKGESRFWRSLPFAFKKDCRRLPHYSKKRVNKILQSQQTPQECSSAKICVLFSSSMLQLSIHFRVNEKSPVQFPMALRRQRYRFSEPISFCVITFSGTISGKEMLSDASCVSS